MIKINLLPRKVTRKKMTVIRHLILGLALLAVVVAAMGYLWFDQKSRIAALARSVQEAQQEKEKLKNVNQEKDQHQKTITDLKHRVDVISQIEKGRTVPVHLLDEVTKILDEKTRAWLASFNYSSRGITMSGYAFTNDDVSAFLKKLDESPYYKNVSLGVSQKQVQSGKEIYQFTLTAEVENPQGG